MAITTSSPPRIDLFQPGLEALRKAISRTSLSQGQVDHLLFHLDTRNYLFTAFAIAKNSLQPGSPPDINQQAQNLVVLLKNAVDLSQDDLKLASDVVPSTQERLDQLAANPAKALDLYQNFEQEYPQEQTSDPNNYQDSRGGKNPLLEEVEKKAKGKIKGKLKEIWENFKKSPTGEQTENFFAAEAAKTTQTAITSAEEVFPGISGVTTSLSAGIAPETGAVIGSAATTIIAPSEVAPTTSALAIVPTNVPGISLSSQTAAAAGGRVVGFAMPSDIATNVVGKEMLSFGILERVPTAGVSKVFGAAAKAGTEYFSLTSKGAAFVSKIPNLASTLNYIASTAGVTTFTTTTGTAGGVISGTAVGTVAGTTAGGALGTGTGAAAGVAAGGVAGTAAGGVAGTAAGAGAGAGTGAAAGAAGGSVGGPVAIITAVIGAILGFLASLIPRYKEDIEAVVVGGTFLAMSGLSGFALGPSVLVGAGAGGIYRAVRTGTLGTMLQGLLSSIFAVVVIPLATPLIIIVIVVPLFVIFISYIVTASSYVTPYNPFDLTIQPLAGGPGGVPAPGPGGYIPPPGPGVPGPTINPWPPPGSRPPPGPGSEYPHCWPLRAEISQLPGCDGNPAHATWSHCCYLVGNTCTQPSEPVWNAYDMAAGAGTPVYATHDGLACAIVSDTGWGNLVTVTSSVGFQTYYAHLLGFTFSGCVDITGGTQIGTVDNTGNSSGDHLHYGITGGSLIQQVIPPVDQNIGLYQTPQGCVANNPPSSNICQWPNYCIHRPDQSCNPGDAMTNTLICDPNDDQYFCCVHATPTPSPMPPPLPTPI